MTSRDVIQSTTSGSLMGFTRYFFKKKFKRKFVVNEHHTIIADALERVMSGKCRRLMINIAPRYGKTELAVKNFIAYAISLNPSSKFIHLSYSDDLALDNSEEVRDLIQDADYQEVYPHVQIKKDSKSKKKWYTTEGGGVYSTSSSGQVTGFGAGKVDEEDLEEELTALENMQGFGGAIVIDDPIKPDDAESSTIRERVNNKFDSTIKNRVNSRNTPIILIMQRLHPEDLCGHIIKNDDQEWEVLSLPCIKEDGTALWPFKHDIDELKALRGKTKANINIFDRQYMQNPKPLQGLLYSDFKTYNSDDVPAGLVHNYTDTADTGKDYLCSISYVKKGTLFYITDVYYSQDRNEITEPALTKMLQDSEVNVCKIESNNGGRSFARNIERLSKAANNSKLKVTWFHQSQNKETRIKSNSSTVNNCIVMPDDWLIKWAEFYDHVTNYMAEGKNKHDDSVDVLTGIVENNPVKWEVF